MILSILARDRVRVWGSQCMFRREKYAEKEVRKYLVCRITNHNCHTASLMAYMYVFILFRRSFNVFVFATDNPYVPCGVQTVRPHTKRIVGGSVATPGSWPWTVCIDACKLQWTFSGDDINKPKCFLSNPISTMP